MDREDETRTGRADGDAWAARFDALVASHGDFVCRCDRDGNLTYVSPTLRAIVRGSRAQLLGRPLASVLEPGVAFGGAAEPRTIAPDAAVHHGETVLGAGTPSERRIQWVSTARFANDGRLVEVQCVGRDVSALRRLERALAGAERELDRIRGQDALTGVSNAFQFADRLGVAVRAAKRAATCVAVLHVEIGDLDRVAETFGERVRDEVVAGSARRIAACVRATDSVGRTGDGSFAVLLSGVMDAGLARGVAGKVRTQLVTPHMIAGRAWSVDVSVGVAVYPDDAPCADTLLDAARGAPAERRISLAAV